MQLTLLQCGKINSKVVTLEISDRCDADRDPYDLRRAVNVYHSFRHETYKFITRKHRVVSLRFEHVETVNHHTYGIRTMHTR